MKNFKIIVCALLMLISLVSAQSVEIKFQVQLIPNILAFDRNQLRFGNPATIGVSSDDALKNFDDFKDKANVNGRPLVATKMGSIDDITQFKAVYIDDNWGKDIAKIVEIAKANQILVICKKEDWLGSGGAVSFRKVLNKPQIVVHQENSKALNSNFMANFLKAVVVL